MPHCETCECDNPSALSTFNLRIKRLVAAIDFEVELPLQVRERIDWASRRFAFSFTGLKLTSTSRATVGQFLVALYPIPHASWLRGVDADPRFFAVSTLGPIQVGLGACSGSNPMVPVAIEYKPGDQFEIYQCPQLEDLEEMAAWDDAKLTQYLRLHIDPLMKVVVKAAAE